MFENFDFLKFFEDSQGVKFKELEFEELEFYFDV
jgi:hypothetical protein